MEKGQNIKKAMILGQVLKMSAHNTLNWSDFLLCIASELAYTQMGLMEEDPIKTQIIAEKIESLGGKL